MYQREVDVDMLNAVECVGFFLIFLIFNFLSISSSSEQRVDYGLGESLYIG